MEFSQELTDPCPDPDPVNEKLRQIVLGHTRENTRHAFIDFWPGYNFPPNFDWTGIAGLVQSCKKLKTFK